MAKPRGRSKSSSQVRPELPPGWRVHRARGDKRWHISGWSWESGVPRLVSYIPESEDRDHAIALAWDRFAMDFPEWANWIGERSNEHAWVLETVDDYDHYEAMAVVIGTEDRARELAEAGGYAGFERVDLLR